MRSSLAKLACLICFATLLAVPRVSNAAQTSSAFPVAAHDNASIEWWYLFAHVTIKSQRHLALVISFFRFADPTGQSPTGETAKEVDSHQDHYLLCAVTDQDTGTHTTYSLADKNTLESLETMAALASLADPNSPRTKELAKLASSGKLPGSSKVIPGACTVTSAPHFGAAYGKVASLKTVVGKPNTFLLTFTDPGKEVVSLQFAAQKAPMYVGGTGNTGIVRPDDMKYVSLTRCAVIGSFNSGSGPESASGDGWFDHQWGSSWLPTAVGWDWFGVQLSDGRDILLFRQRTLSSGAIFGPLATIEDKDGNLTVTHNLIFTPDKSAIWQSAKTGVNYPLGWTIDMPDQKLELHVNAAIQDQELPALGNTGGAIWEGTVKVVGYYPFTPGQTMATMLINYPGKGYMELVGYGAPAVAANLQSAK